MRLNRNWATGRRRISRMKKMGPLTPPLSATVACAIRNATALKEEEEICISTSEMHRRRRPRRLLSRRQIKRNCLHPFPHSRCQPTPPHCLAPSRNPASFCHPAPFCRLAPFRDTTPFQSLAPFRHPTSYPIHPLRFISPSSLSPPHLLSAP